MAGLQRSTSSFRRQGSSGLVWDDKLLAAEVKKAEHEKQQQQKQKQKEEDHNKEEANPSTTAVGSISTLDRSRSNGGDRAFRTDKVSPAPVEPPSPKLSACGFCGAFGKAEKNRRRPKSGRRR